MGGSSVLAAFDGDTHSVEITVQQMATIEANTAVDSFMVCPFLSWLSVQHSRDLSDAVQCTVNMPRLNHKPPMEYEYMYIFKYSHIHKR